MSMTLLEASKMMTGDLQRQGVIETYIRESDPLRVLPFLSTNSLSYTYKKEDTLPGIGFRALNEAFTEATGVINPETEQYVIAGGDLDVDKVLVDTHGMELRAMHVMGKVKKLAHTYSHKFIKGDSITTAEEFDGLQLRLTGNQLIANDTTSGGAVLSLTKLDEAIDACENPTHLFMSRAMRRVLTAAARNTSVGGFISYDKDEFGRRVTVYNDLPILLADELGDSETTLGFNEAYAGGGTANGTSIYVLSLMDGMLQGLQSGPPQVRDLGEINEKPVYRTRVEWVCSLGLLHPRAASRLYSIKSGAAAA